MLHRSIQTFVFVGIALLFSACPRNQSIHPDAWAKFESSLNEPRLYAMRREERDIPFLIKALESKNSVVRFNAVQDLKTMGSAGKKATQPLIRCFEDRDVKTGRVAYLAVKGMGVPSVEAVPALREMLDSKKARAQVWALKILSSMGKQALVAVPDIAPLLDARDGKVRWRAALLLHELAPGHSKERVVEVLAESLGDDDPKVRERSRALLYQLGRSDVLAVHEKKLKEESEKATKIVKNVPPSVQQKQFKKMSSKDESVVYEVARDVRRIYAREYMEKRDPGVINQWKGQIPFLVRMLGYGNTRERLRTVQTLRTMGFYLEEAIGPIVGALDDPEPKVRLAAVSALGDLQIPQAVPKISTFLDDREFRSTAARALKKINTPEALNAVKDFSAEEFEDEDKVKVTIQSRKKIDLEKLPTMSYGEALGLCRLVLKNKGFGGPELMDLTDRCIMASEARY